MGDNVPFGRVKSGSGAGCATFGMSVPEKVCVCLLSVVSVGMMGESGMDEGRVLGFWSRDGWSGFSRDWLIVGKKKEPGKRLLFCERRNGLPVAFTDSAGGAALPVGA